MPVSKAPQWKKWGTSVSEVLDGVTITEEIKFKNIMKADGTIASGPHGITSGGVSDAAHKELFDIVDSSSDFDEYKHKLNDWADEHFELVDMEGRMKKSGAVALPENLQTNETKIKCKKK